MSVFPYFEKHQHKWLTRRDLTLILQSTNCTTTPMARKDWPICLKIDGVGDTHTHTHILYAQQFLRFWGYMCKAQHLENWSISFTIDSVTKIAHRRNTHHTHTHTSLRTSHLYVSVCLAHTGQWKKGHLKIYRHLFWSQHATFPSVGAFDLLTKERHCFRHPVWAGYAYQTRPGIRRLI